MKVLLLTSFFPPTHTAGTEKRTFGYAKTLLARGHQVQVCCAGDWETGERYWNGYIDEIYQGIPVRRVHLNWQKSPDPNAYLYRNPLIQNKMAKWLGEWKPDLVHITSCITLSASVIAAAKAQGLPVVLTLTDFWFICPKLSLLKYDQTLCDGITTSQDCIRCLCWGSTIYRKLRKYASDKTVVQILNQISKIPLISRQRGFRGMTLDISNRKTYLTALFNTADIITAPSNHLANTIQRSGIKKEIRVIQSGHDLSWLRRGIEKKPGSRVRFGYIGQMIPTKGVHILMEAFCAQDWNGHAELHFYGNHQTNAAYFHQLEQIKGTNPSTIFFHGPFPHEKLGDILAEIDLLVVPSLWHENNPRVIQEAFASKTPVIASDVGGIAEYVQHEVNGFLFQRGDSADLRAQLSRVIQNREQIRQLITHIPEVKSIGDEMDSYESIYRGLASKLEVKL